MNQQSPARGLTVRDVAQLLRVSEDKVRNWIRNGELCALNTAAIRVGKPRFVILPDALQAFTAARAAAAPAAPKPTRKKRTCLVDYFPD
jgi:excisionase family DNA binding protein